MENNKIKNKIWKFSKKTKMKVLLTSILIVFFLFQKIIGLEPGEFLFDFVVALSLELVGSFGDAYRITIPVIILGSLIYFIQMYLISWLMIFLYTMIKKLLKK